jgi:hypothetical protein
VERGLSAHRPAWTSQVIRGPECSLLVKPMMIGNIVYTFVHGAQPPAECVIVPTNSRASRVCLKSYLNSLHWVAESWTGMGWVAAFFASMRMIQGPCLKSAETVF